MSTTTKELDALSYQELKTLTENKKAEEIKRVTKELTSAEGIVASLKAQLVELGEKTVEAATSKRRGRKPNSLKLNEAQPVRASKAKKGKRGAVGDAIRAFVGSKGKAGAKVSEIAAATGNKPANVTAFFYSKANKKAFKKVAPATFAVNGK
jgi:hypothetical protein